MPKTVYTWMKVKAGDIISFRYKGNKPTGLLTTILVLNPRMPYIKKDGTKTFHLIGLKLERNSVIPIIKSKSALFRLLSTVGEVTIVDEDNDIYKVLIEGVGAKGVKPGVYKRIKALIKRYSVYRTYDYKEARKSRVFLEPIVLPKEVKPLLSGLDNIV